MNFKTMSIRAKLIFAFASIVILMSCALITALGSMRAVSDANAVVRDHLQPAQTAVADLRLAVRRADDMAAHVAMSRNASETDDIARHFEAEINNVHAAFKRALDLADTDEQRAALADFEKLFDGEGQYLAQTRRGIALKRAGKSADANSVFLGASVDTSIDNVVRYQNEAKRMTSDGAAHAAQLQELALVLSISLGGLGLIVSIAAVFITLRSTSSTVREVNRSVYAVSAAASQISSGNSDLSQRTEEQAASLEETAASMEEFTATVKQNADNARQANSLAIGASRVAEDGGAVVTEMVSTMSSIGESAKRIENIISVIDGIAFQTNILALNAAVEAARAGEQGRGFAVVAGEVRNLAQRSASAAKEIKTLISDSVEKTGTGIKLADRAGSTMAEIVTSVRRVTDIMNEISAASNEQSTGVDQVAQAISQMDQVTQQNAALVEEIAAAATSLEQMSEALATSMSVFGFDAGTTETAHPTPKPTVSVRHPAVGKATRRPVGAGAPARAAVPATAGRTDENGDWHSF